MTKKFIIIISIISFMLVISLFFNFLFMQSIADHVGRIKILESRNKGLTSLKWCEPDMVTYKNDVYGFELSYSNDFVEEENKSRGGLLALTKVESKSSHFVKIYIRKDYQVEENMKYKDRPARKYFFQEGAGYSGVFQLQLDNNVLEIVYDILGGGVDSDEDVRKELNKIVESIKVEVNNLTNTEL